MTQRLNNIFTTSIKTIAVCYGLFIGIATASAQEITAIDFNGDLIGKVIPDGKVVSFENQLIGNITADSLIVNFDGNLIGGVVPQGIAIGNDNRLLGKVNNDGTVRLATGKIVGKVLPNGLVVDDRFAVLGAVLFPGLIYSDDGETVGRLTGDGMYANLQGQTIGFISPDGYAYRKLGNDYSLDGRLISSKMVIDVNGQFIGSVTPGGKVTNFDGKIIGNIKANGFAYNENDKVIGKIVKSGYAFDITGKYIGFVSYNGEVFAKEKKIGKLTGDSAIVDDKGEIIGFMVDISATASDASGRYIGRIIPEGKIVQGRTVIGQIGPWNVIYDKDSKEIGKLISAGPIFDYRGNLRAHGLKNSQVILLGGTPLGYMRGNIAIDSSGKVIGSTLPEQLVVDDNNKPLGITGINSVLTMSDDKKFVSPLGYVYNIDGIINGNLLPFGGIYSLNGDLLSTLYPNGEMINNGAIASGKLTQYGINIDERNLVLGKNIDASYAVNQKGENIGILADGNLVLDKNFTPIAKILPDSSVVAIKKDSNPLMPVIGKAGSAPIAISFEGRLLGYVNNSGSVKDLGALTIGKVNARDVVLDNNNLAIGGVIDYAPVINRQCDFIGVVSPQGEVRNYREVNMGRVLPNLQVVSETGVVIGFALNPSSVVDYNGNTIGIVSANGKVLNYNSDNLGCIDAQGRLYNTQKALVGKVTEIASAINFDGKVIGRTMLDGSVINVSGQPIGYMRPDDSITSKTGMPLGILLKYRFAFDNNNKLIGFVQDNGEVYNDKNIKIAAIDFEGNIVNAGQKIGYALYDMYIYDGQKNAIGYIANDGTVMSFNNQNIGKMSRGFLIDKSGKLLGRGNRDFQIREKLNAIIGELNIDGDVYDAKGQLVGSLGMAGDIIASDGQVIATATPLQYYEAERKQPVYDNNGNVIGYVTEGNNIIDSKGNIIGQLGKDGYAVALDGTVIGNTKLDWYQKPITQPSDLPKIGSRSVETDTAQFRRSLNIALTPDGEYLGEVMDDGSVVDKKGNVVGRLLPDGLVVDSEGSLIGVEESAKSQDKSDVFVPAGTFGEGGAYGTGGGAGNLGPGGGFGPGERYDGQRSAALSTAQGERRKNMEVGKISTNVRKEAFDGMQKNWDEQGIPKAISSWRVDMSEMIFADKPIPAVIARSIDSSNPAPVTAFVERNIYAEEGRNIIIPAGSRLMGTLGSVIASTETASESAKVQITWERLVRPDGVVFVFQGLTGDAQGRGGALGYLDQQLFKKYSLPLATTMLTSATSYMLATNDTSGTGETETSRQQAANDARQNFLDQMNQIFQQILADKTNIRPLTYVPAGTRIIVYPNVDLWLRTIERDSEVSTNDKRKDILIDDKETQDKIATRAAERKVKNAGASSSVVYEADQADAKPAATLIDEKPTTSAPKSGAGAPPPPPPSSSRGSSSSISGGGSSVPQLF